QDYTPVTIEGSPAGAEISISYYADEGPSIAPVTFYVPFARYVVNISAPGYQPATLEINAVDRSGMARSYVLARTTTADTGGGDVGAPDPVGDGSAGDVGGAELDGQISGSAPPRARPRWPLVLAGGGVVAVAAGALAFRSAYNLSENGTCEPEDVGPDGKCPRGPVLVREVIAYSLMGAGAAAITAGLILYFREPSGDSSTPLVSAGPLRDGGMVFFTWSK
ncbi:MAG TPA: PEGA domain-containing protein, partial [Kofleriaceae bacterium]|nr:PEGA domain-containing protein [Kofleriaceae bacterium]